MDFLSVASTEMPQQKIVKTNFKQWIEPAYFLCSLWNVKHSPYYCSLHIVILKHTICAYKMRCRISFITVPEFHVPNYRQLNTSCKTNNLLLLLWFFLDSSMYFQYLIDRCVFHFMKKINIPKSKEARMNCYYWRQIAVSMYAFLRHLCHNARQKKNPNSHNILYKHQCNKIERNFGISFDKNPKFNNTMTCECVFVFVSICLNCIRIIISRHRHPDTYGGYAKRIKLLGSHIAKLRFE